MDPRIGIVSTAVKRLGQVCVLFREISFTMKWKHEQGNMSYLLSVNVFLFLSVERVSLRLNTPQPVKNGVNKSEFAHFQILRTFLVKFQNS